METPQPSEIEVVETLTPTDLPAEIQAHLQQILDDAAGTEEAEPDTEVDYEGLAMEVAVAFSQLYQQGEQVAFLLINPALEAGFRQAFQALPDEAVPQAIKEGLPIHVDADLPRLRIITATDLEYQFLHQYFGPAPHGNNKLPRLMEYLQKQPYPVRVDLNVLRVLYILDALKRTGIDVEIATPGSQLFTGIRR